MQKSEELSNEGALQVNMDPEMSPEYEFQDKAEDKLEVSQLFLV